MTSVKSQKDRCNSKTMHECEWQPGTTSSTWIWRKKTKQNKHPNKQTNKGPTYSKMNHNTMHAWMRIWSYGQPRKTASPTWIFPGKQNKNKTIYVFKEITTPSGCMKWWMRMTAQARSWQPHQPEFPTPSRPPSKTKTKKNKQQKLSHVFKRKFMSSWSYSPTWTLHPRHCTALYTSLYYTTDVMTWFPNLATYNRS